MKFNNYVVCGEIIKIEITNKKNETNFVLIDNKDLDKINSCKWCLNSMGYPYNSHNGLMYHLILQMKPKFPELIVDHINGNPLDCRKNNLRVVNHATNMINKRFPGKMSNNQSGFRGVYWYPNYEKWCTQIRRDKKTTHVGYFNNFLEACNARILAEKQYMEGD